MSSRVCAHVEVTRWRLSISHGRKLIVRGKSSMLSRSLATMTKGTVIHIPIGLSDI